MALCIDCDTRVSDLISERAERDRADDLARRFRLSGLPHAYVTGERTLGNIGARANDALSAALMVQSGAIPGLYLWGPAGSLKTSVAAAFLATEIRAGGTGRYVYTPDLMSDIHASYGDSGDETRSEIVERFVLTPRLVLDDLGKEKASKHAAEVLAQILDGRYRWPRRGRWLIVTSNFSMDELCERFPNWEATANPIRRRLAEMTVSVPMGAS